MRIRIRRLSRLSIAGVLLALEAVAAAGGLDPQRGRIVIETEVIRVPVTVSDRRGRFIPGLKQQDFEVLDDGVLQELTSFSIEESAIAVELLIDVSGSMSGRLEEVKRAATQFVQLMGPKDVTKIVQFDERATALSDFSSDKTALIAAIARARTGGSTALRNALSMAMDDLGARKKDDEAEQRHRAIIVLTDGDDTASAVTEDEILVKAGRVDALVYSLSLDRVEGRPAMDGTSAIFLNQLGVRTGGQLQFPELADLSKFYRQLADELRHQYVLGYVSAGTRPGVRWHTITVRIKNRRDVRLRHRLNYFGGSGRMSQ